MARLPGSVSIGPRDTEILFTQRPPPLFWESSVTRTVYDSVERSASFLSIMISKLVIVSLHLHNVVDTYGCIRSDTISVSWRV